MFSKGRHGPRTNRSNFGGDRDPGPLNDSLLYRPTETLQLPTCPLLWPPCLPYPIRRNAASTTTRVADTLHWAMPCAQCAAISSFLLQFPQTTKNKTWKSSGGVSVAVLCRRFTSTGGRGFWLWRLLISWSIERDVWLGLQRGGQFEQTSLEPIADFVHCKCLRATNWPGTTDSSSTTTTTTGS